MKLLLLVLAVVFVFLQYRLWFGEGSLAEVFKLQRELAQQRQETAALEARNAELRAEVESLRKDDDAMEARARRELGLIREGETYFQLLEPDEGSAR
ncbi:MAG: cell division protein FtsB [Gammaproteobacteria bacterium]|nr:MAG: cell division protein FtsB [Gammaproteobacteria bacterium]